MSIETSTPQIPVEIACILNTDQVCPRKLKGQSIFFEDSPNTESSTELPNSPKDTMTGYLRFIDDTDKRAIAIKCKGSDVSVIQNEPPDICPVTLSPHPKPEANFLFKLLKLRRA